MSTAAVAVRRVDAPVDVDLDGLCDVLVDCVEGGASVSFMLPMTREKALAFWRGVADDVARGGRLLFVAEDGGRIVGTVQLIVGLPENQPHRAEIAKMLVSRPARQRGVGAALMSAAEQAARDAGRTLLVLDTANPDAERLYARLGWQRVGAIPGFALLPEGSPCATTIFYRNLA